jgi:quercetin dioxygenase-like cupin family protein
VLVRIVTALRVSFGALLDVEEAPSMHVLPAQSARLLSSQDGAMVSRALFPWDLPRRSELYQVELKPKAIEHAAAHTPGTTENLVVSEGSVTVHVAGQPVPLKKGDAFFFQADVKHAYENTADTPAILYMMVAYPHEVGG